jgi:hypothetical protein
MERKHLSILSPPKVEGNDELHLTINRTEYAEDSSIRTENQLYDDYLPYVPHDKGKFTMFTANIFVDDFSLGECVHICSNGT